MARMAGVQATHWFWQAQWPRNVFWEFKGLVLIIPVAQKRGLGIRVGEESNFGNSRGLEPKVLHFIILCVIYWVAACTIVVSSL